MLLSSWDFWPLSHPGWSFFDSACIPCVPPQPGPEGCSVDLQMRGSHLPPGLSLPSHSRGLHTSCSVNQAAQVAGQAGVWGEGCGCRASPLLLLGANPGRLKARYMVQSLSPFCHISRKLSKPTLFCSRTGYFMYNLPRHRVIKFKKQI